MTKVSSLAVFFLATFLLVGCESSKKEESGSPEFEYEEISNGTLQGKQRTPDVKIADSKKELKFPIKIGGLEITRFSNSVGYGENSRPITWKAHFKKDESTIVNKAAIYNLSGNLKCDQCGKTNHTAYKDGKPFSFKLIKDLKK